MQIARLEDYPGVSLFERSKRHVVPTDTAVVILPLADAVVSGFRQNLRTARGSGACTVKDRSDRSNISIGHHGIPCIDSF
jgi:DNA-binding transcriptional LysR family regulator